VTSRSFRSREALEETKETNAINVESENSVISGAEVNDLDLRNVSVREQQEDLGQNRDTDFLSRILKMMKGKIGRKFQTTWTN